MRTQLLKNRPVLTTVQRIERDSQFVRGSDQRGLTFNRHGITCDLREIYIFLRYLHPRLWGDPLVVAKPYFRDD